MNTARELTLLRQLQYKAESDISEIIKSLRAALKQRKILELIFQDFNLWRDIRTIRRQIQNLAKSNKIGLATVLRPGQKVEETIDFFTISLRARPDVFGLLVEKNTAYVELISGLRAKLDSFFGRAVNLKEN